MFFQISSDINAYDPPDPKQRTINLKSVNCNYSLTSQLEEKVNKLFVILSKQFSFQWKSAINNKISTSLNMDKNSQLASCWR